MSKKLHVTLVKSPIGYTLRQKKTVRALGLGHINKTVVLPDTPPMRGMVNAIIHLVKVEEVEE